MVQGLGLLGIDKEGGFTTSDGFQNSLFGSVNGANGFEGSGVDSSRIKLMGSNQQVEVINLSEGTSPLGLTLKKSESFIDLIETKLSQGRKVTTPTDAHRSVASEKTRSGIDDFVAQPREDKLKASNFRADLLRIGTYVVVSENEAHLIAKCYYAKRKLVWEVLEDGLKKKIEVQWSDISGIRAAFQENGRGILEIELCYPPLFLRESNPQPRKHSVWVTTNDFTGGQAPMCRRHYLEFPKGTLEKHYLKLLQCDSRLLILSQRPFPTQNSLFFYSHFKGYPNFPVGFNGHQPEFPHKLQSSHLSIHWQHQPGFLHGLQSSYLSIPRPHQPEFLHGVHSPLLSIPRHPLVPSHQVKNFGTTTMRPSLCVNDSTSPMSVMDFPTMEENGCNHIIEHQRTSFWNNAQNIYKRKRDQIGELPLIASANQDSHWGTYNLLSSRDMTGNPPSNNLLSSGDVTGNPPSNNLLLTEIYNHLLNDPSSNNLLSSGDVRGNPPSNDLLLTEISDHLLYDPSTSIGPDEQRVLKKLESVSSLLDASSEPNPLVNTGMMYTDNGYKYTMNDQVMLRSIDQSTGGAGLLCPDVSTWLPAQDEIQSMHIPLTHHFPTSL